jgi:hypothetical protein
MVTGIEIDKLSNFCMSKGLRREFWTLEFGACFSRYFRSMALAFKTRGCHPNRCSTYSVPVVGLLATHVMRLGFHHFGAAGEIEVALSLKLLRLTRAIYRANVFFLRRIVGSDNTSAIPCT